MGRQPMLPPLYEADLVTWILAMERDGHPVNRSQIQDKAAEMLNVIHGFTRPAKPTSGWYQKFLARNEALKTKNSNCTSKKRRPRLTSPLLHALALMGPRFRLCLFSPAIAIPGAAVTTSEKGWTNSFICRKWLSMLSSAIPTSTARPILLIVNGCSSHYSNYIYDEAQRLEILLLFLPANSTHMFQPLDVTVFRPFKQAIRQEIANDKWNDVASSISKQEAIAIACRVWTLTTKESSITNGFDCTGLCPPSLDKMLYRLSIFKPPQDASVAIDDTWLKQCAIVRNELLVLPPQKKKRVARKTLTVSGKFITADYHAILQSQAAARPKARKKSQSATSTPADQDYDVVVSEEEMELVEL
ncbi:hypothetical protein DYB28_009447 [Aphanomyces astaci]|uniref:HTH CENPB-type domain-containing protein n=1 Tax=Aphanomyces astaci TaxID=112090 RepID=A0A9X8DSU7_APHAT|nr:hypothetical protein DYB28_009447 [Aphanomyces astaci]